MRSILSVLLLHFECTIYIEQLGTMSSVQSTVARVDSTVEPAREQESLAKTDDAVSGASPANDEEGSSTAEASVAKSGTEDDATEKTPSQTYCTLRYYSDD